MDVVFQGGEESAAGSCREAKGGGTTEGVRSCILHPDGTVGRMRKAGPDPFGFRETRPRSGVVAPAVGREDPALAAPGASICGDRYIIGGAGRDPAGPFGDGQELVVRVVVAP